MTLRLVWLGLAAFLLALVTVLPVRWVTGFVPPQVTCMAWAGSIWRGQCSGLIVRQPGGGELQADVLSWKLHPAALLRLAIRADFTARNALGNGSGVVELDRNGLAMVEHLAVSTVFDRRLATMLAEGWSAQLEASDLTLKMQGSTLEALSGELALRDFRDGRGGTFGSYRLVFPPAAAPPFTGTLTDVGGPLEVAASVVISADRRWRLDGLVTPRPGAPPWLRSRLEMLAAPDATGRYRLQSEGSFK